MDEHQDTGSRAMRARKRVRCDPPFLQTRDLSAAFDSSRRLYPMVDSSEAVEVVESRIVVGTSGRRVRERRWFSDLETDEAPGTELCLTQVRIRHGRSLLVHQ